MKILEGLIAGKLGLKLPLLKIYFGTTLAKGIGFAFWRA